MTDLQSILDCYTRLTGREARLPVYEFALFDFCRAGFTAGDMAVVITFIIRENKRNNFKYSLKLGHLINDHMRFNDLLEEARAKERNRKPHPTPKEQVLNQFRPAATGETATGNAMTIKDVLKKIIT